MRNNEGFIDICKILGIPNKDYLNTPDLYKELKTILEGREDVNIIKFRVGTNLVFSFNYNGETYYFNFDSRVDPYTNLIYEEVCKELGVEAATYDLAIIGNIRGNVSPNYKKKAATYISGYKILKQSKINKAKGDEDVLAPSLFPESEENLGNVLLRYNTLESIWAALEIRYAGKSDMQEIVQKIMDKLTWIFAVDILLGNTDRNYTNWEIVEYPDGNVDLAPAYDGARSLMDYPFAVNLALSVETRTTYFSQLEFYDNVLKFLKVSTIKDSEKITGSLWILSEQNAMHIISKIEEKTQKPMPLSDQTFLQEKFRIYKESLEEILDDYKASLKR